MDHDFIIRRRWRNGARLTALASLLYGSLAAKPALAGGALTTSPEQGFDLGSIENPRSLGTGGAQVATGGSVNSAYDNPANMSVDRVYHIEGVATFSPEARRDSFGGGIVDSMINSAKLAGGLAGAWNQLDPNGINRKWSEGRVSLAYPFGDRLAIGVAGRYLAVTQSVGTGPFGGTYVSDGTPNSAILKAFTFDVGANLMLVEGLRLGVVGHNLTTTTNPLMPMTFEGGLGYGWKPPGDDAKTLFSIEGSGLLDLSTWNTARYRLMIGGELLLIDHLIVRAGFRYDQATSAAAPSVGVGYTDRQWGVEVGARHDVTGPTPNTMLGVSVRLYYDPMAPVSSSGMGM